MNRRFFIGSIAGTLGAMTLDPERLLWVPGRKFISIPGNIIRPFWCRICGPMIEHRVTKEGFGMRGHIKTIDVFLRGCNEYPDWYRAGIMPEVRRNMFTGAYEPVSNVHRPGR